MNVVAMGPAANEDTQNTEAASAPKRKRAHVRSAAVPDPNVEVSVFGSVPVAATHWGLKRKSHLGRWEPLFYRDETGKIEVSEWPIEILNIDTVRDRFGGGRYKLTWYGSNGNGGRRVAGQGREFTVPSLEPSAPASVAMVPAPSVASPLGGAFSEALRIMDVMDQRASSQITNLAQMAQLFGSRGGGGDNELLRQLLESNARTNEAVNQLAQRMNEPEEGDEDEGGEVAADVARAVAAPLARRVKSSGGVLDSILAAFANHCIDNPERIPTYAAVAAQAVPSILGVLSNAFSQVQAQAPRPAQPPPRPVQAPAPAPAPYVQPTPAPPSAPRPRAEVRVVDVAAPVPATVEQPTS